MAMKARAARGVLWSLVEFGGGEIVSFASLLVLDGRLTAGGLGRRTVAAS
jgi:hypothetical protein